MVLDVVFVAFCLVFVCIFVVGVVSLSCTILLAGGGELLLICRIWL